MRPECDLVMKGGIASGLVYPSAIRRLAQTYRFRSIGGSSAGAIGAAAAAAAEFRRQETGSEEGFARLGSLPKMLCGDALTGLFEPRPDSGTAFAWRIVREAIADDTRMARILGALGQLLIGGWKGTLAGLFVTAIAVLNANIVGAIAAGILGVSITVGLALLACLVRMREALGDNWMGITRGLGCEGDAGSDCLTRFLHREINAIAGFGDDETLTLGHLARHDIEFKAMTTALSHGRPYRLPFSDGERFYYLPDDMRTLFPGSVVDHMVAASKRILVQSPRTRVPVAPSGLLPLPDSDDLPVLLLVRMSLSFPVLLSTVPLWAVDFRENGSADAASGPSRRSTRATGLVAERCWFSDGGICLNFPIHLFDAPIPARPTFGINLRYPVDGSATGKPMAGDNTEGSTAVWYRSVTTTDKGLPTGDWVLRSMFHTLRQWTDQSRSGLPGYRDRIYHVDMADGEGGLNIAMPPEVVARLEAKGATAADALIGHFTRDMPNKNGTGWDNHRWLRYRTTMAQLEEYLAHFANGMEETGPFIRSQHDLPAREQISYRFDSDQQLTGARWSLRELQGLIADWRQRCSTLGRICHGYEDEVIFRDGAPRPRPELRSAPRI